MLRVGDQCGAKVKHNHATNGNSTTNGKIGGGSGDDPQPLWDCSFEFLIDQARAAHDLEVRRLQHEVFSLRQELQMKGTREAILPPVHEEQEALYETATAPSPTVLIPPPPEPDSPHEEEARRETRVSTCSSGKAGHGLDGTMKRKQTKELLAKQRGCLWALVTRPAFEIFVAVAIAANGVMMAIEAQYAGFSLAEATGHASARGASSEVWPSAQTAFDVLNLMFGTFFLVEIFSKIAGLRWDFVYDAWNWMDLAIALLWLVSEISSTLINAQFLRLARLAKLIRLVRLAKFVPGMDSLVLLTTALKGSIATVTWAFATLLAIHVMLAIFINNVLRECYFDPEPSKAPEQVDVYAYFGSFSRAFLTSFEITLANWPTSIRVLVENVSEGFILYAVLHKTVFGFAVVGVINAVFIQETFKAAAADDNLMVRQTRMKEQVHGEKMNHLFFEADENADGTIDAQEWKAICQDEWVQVWLRSQEIKASDAEGLFAWLDNGDGRLTAQELIQGTAALKGPSAVMSILQKLQQLDKSVNAVRGDLLVDSAVLKERML